MNDTPRNASGWPPEPGVIDPCELLARRAVERPGEVAYVFMGADGAEQHCTWTDLDLRARPIAARLIAAGAQRALLIDEPRIELLVALVACMQAGVAAIPVPPPRGRRARERLAVVLMDALPEAVLGVSTMRQADPEGVKLLPPWIDTDTVAEALPAEAYRRPFDPDRIALVQYTSGSTSEPRGVLIDYRNLSAQERAIREAFGHRPDSRVVTWLPPYHDMGLIGGLLQPLYAGLPCLWFSPPVFLADPVLWLRAISRFRGTTSGGPDFAYELCVRRIQDEQLQGVDLSSWEVAFNGSEPVRAETLDRFAQRFARHGFRREAFLPCYGLAEATLMVSGKPPALAPTSLRLERDTLEEGRAVRSSESDGRQVTLTGCGRPVPGMEVKVVDPEHRRPCSQGVVGEVWVSGPSVVRGYLGHEDAEELSARLPGDDRRYLRTGDLGFHDKQGELFIVGRLKDLIIVRGQNHHPEDLERTVQTAFPPLRPACGAAFSVESEGEEAVILVHEIDPVALEEDGGAGLLERIVERTGQDHGVRLREVVFVKPGSLPRTTSGKIRRREVRRRFLEGALTRLSTAPVVAPEPVEIVDAEIRRILDCFASVLPGKGRGARADSDFFSLGGDSLSAHELLARVRQETGVRLDVADLFTASTPRQLAAKLEERRRLEMTPGERLEPGALSPAQQRIWFAEQLRPGHAFYHVGLRLELGADVTVPRLEQALARLAAGQPALRASIDVVDGAPRQRVAARGTVPLSTLKCQGEDELDALAREEVSTPFDLAGPLARALLVYSGAPSAGSVGTRQTLIFTIHHIVCDGWGGRQAVTGLIEELSASVSEVRPRTELDSAYLTACAEAATRAARSGASGATWWRGVLGGAPEAMPLPIDRERPAAMRGRGARCGTVLDRVTWARVVSAAEQARVTPFIVLASALAAVLRTVSGRSDVVFGTVIAQPPGGEAARLMGCHLNFLPLRVALPEGLALRELVERVKGVFSGALAHSEFPFEEMVRAVNPRRDLRGNPLYNVGLWYHDLLSVLPDAVRAQASVVDTQTAELDLRLIATPGADGVLDLSLEYASELFRESTARRLLDGYVRALGAVLSTPEQVVQELDRELSAVVPRAVARRIAIAANFTIEPVAESLEHWAARLAFPLSVEFGAYDQIEQQLLDADSPLRAGSGTLGVIVVDADAWVTADGQFGRVSAFASVVEGLDLSGADLLVAVCPAPDNPTPARAAGIARAREVLLGLSQVNRAVAVLDLSSLGQHYGVTREREPYLDELGRVPFIEDWFAALGTVLFRQVRGRARPPRKVLVLDCDHTLWDGECGGEGGLRVPPNKQALQRTARRLASEGTVVCLCSKNIDADVAAAFSHADMVLTPRDVTARRVNWRPKSENLQSLAEELDLGLDAFVMVDDDPAVCAEISAACPEVTVVQLPSDEAAQAMVLEHLWELDRPAVTAEDRVRGERYREEAHRRELRQRAPSLSAFLAELSVRVNFRPAEEADVARVAQLFARTNQFNLSATRYDESQVAAFVRDGAPECWVVEVEDRFGAYGLTGALVTAQGANTLEVQAMALSCRVLGRGVEGKLLAELQSLARRRSLGALRFNYQRTVRNEPAMAFLAGLGGVLDGDAGTWEVPLDAVLSEAPQAPHAAPPRAAVDDRGSGFAGIPVPVAERSTSAAILQAMRQTSTARPDSAGAYVAPDGSVEERIAEIFRIVLRVDRVGAHDNFFALGGHSLLALKVLWHMHRDFGIDVALNRLHDAPTVAGLADAVVETLIKLDADGVLGDAVRQQGDARP
ncbi:HAD-IIIC family phosphatase [Myxococcus sp. CA040A]|uniref:HAD-IIIC family phosphatase n=1 Tax=Myxococcus sp. CA040A TaxID=2741738 RepID=UPI00157B1F7C|nr:HAD-IIIC family phosphatase [Myxococcus sp. CA040A]NTX02057.1 HAD-IIIC family phosphatase [Myxococcus sp. CA040A]